MVKENGPVPVKDAKRPRVFGFVERPTVSKPTQEQVDAAIDAADADADLHAVIGDLYKTKSGTTFRDYVPEPEETNGD